MTVRITNETTAAQYLAEVGALDGLTVTEDNKVVEHHTCGRCGGRGIYSSFHGVCYECSNLPSRKSWTTHTPIMTFARKVKAENTKRESRRRKSEDRAALALERQRDWCEANGWGRITFEEKRLRQEQKWAEEQKARAAKSAHVGTVKKREDFTVKVERVIGLGYSSYGYGSSQVYNELVKLTTVEGGYSMVWITGKRPAEVRSGAVLKLKATVKEHGDYKGEKQTKVNRAKVVAVIDAGSEPEQEEA